jgi:arylsulfatase A-like enzyme
MRRLARAVPALLLALLVLPAQVPFAAARAADPAERPPNFLVIVADDVGTDRVGLYAGSGEGVRTPNIDRLGRRGLIFENFWVMPACSPTRATLLTGEYPHRTGIGTVVHAKPRKGGAKVGLTPDVETLPRALAPAGYTSAIVGKWHLGSNPQGMDHPLQLGFAHHRGSFGNLAHWSGKGTYGRWVKISDGMIGKSELYATTDTVNDAIEMGRTLPEPWLLIVSFNAAHRPLHFPPDPLHSFGRAAGPQASGPTAFLAMVEAMDTEIGRLLQGLARKHPFVFYLGDNGTEPQAFPAGDPRRKRSKGTLFQGGVRVPFLVSHASIRGPGRRVEGLASAADLFATLVDLARIPRPPSEMPADSISLAPFFRTRGTRGRRDWVLAESFSPNGPAPYQRFGRTVRGPRYKLIRLIGGGELFFDLEDDPGEVRPLVIKMLEGERAAAHRRLSALADAPPAVAGPALSPAPAAE